MEGESGTNGVPAQTLRNCAEDRVLGMIGDLLEGAREIYLSLDWARIRYYGKYAEGLGSGDKGSLELRDRHHKIQGQDAAASILAAREGDEQGRGGQVADRAGAIAGVQD